MNNSTWLTKIRQGGQAQLSKKWMLKKIWRSTYFTKLLELRYTVKPMLANMVEQFSLSLAEDFSNFIVSFEKTWVLSI